MAKNFDYILLLAEEVPGFKRLHEYCVFADNIPRGFSQ